MCDIEAINRLRREIESELSDLESRDDVNSISFEIKKLFVQRKIDYLKREKELIKRRRHNLRGLR